MPKGNPGKIKIDLTNHQYGEWRVNNFSHIDKHGRSVWICQCSCGIIKQVCSASLRSGENKRCNKCRQILLHPHPLNKHIAHAKSRAKKKGYGFDITVEYIEEIMKQQDNKCALSGIKLTSTFYARDHFGTSASLDRIDSSKGYIKGNVQWIHKELNTMKMDASQIDFIKWCKLVADKHK